MKGSLIIIGFFILGTLCGFFHLIPFDISKSNISFLCLVCPDVQCRIECGA